MRKRNIFACVLNRDAVIAEYLLEIIVTVGFRRGTVNCLTDFVLPTTAPGFDNLLFCMCEPHSRRLVWHRQTLRHAYFVVGEANALNTLFAVAVKFSSRVGMYGIYDKVIVNVVFVHMGIYRDFVTFGNFFS